MRKIFLALLALSMGALTANADSLVTVRPLTGTDSVDWSQLGIPETQIPLSFSFITANSVTGTGSYASTSILDVGEVVQQGLSVNPYRDFEGNFKLGDYLNYTNDSGPLTLTFTQGYTQIGAQIESNDFGQFTAQICDSNNSCFTEVGYADPSNNNSAIYIGIDSSSPITWVTFSLTSVGGNGRLNSFAINEVTLDGPVVTSEPSSFLLLGTGLVGLASALRRKFAR